MIPFKIFTEGKEFNILCPTSWEDLKMSQFYALKREWDGSDFVHLIAILCNIDKAVIFNSSSLDIQERILPHLEFIKEPIQLLKYTPQELTLFTKTIEVVQDITLCSFGQKIALQNALAGKDDWDCLPICLAYYLYPAISSQTFSETHAKKLVEPLMKEIGAIEGISIGTFFLNSFVKSLSENQQNQRQTTRQSRLRRAWKSFKNMASSQPLTPLREVT